jgi:hypothetical protein
VKLITYTIIAKVNNDVHKYSEHRSSFKSVITYIDKGKASIHRRQFFQIDVLTDI